MKPVNVLITGCGGTFIKDTIDCLRKNGERIVNVFGSASEPDEHIKPLLTGYYRVPRSEHEDYLDTILSLCEQHRIHVVIPTVAAELALFAESRDQFENVGTAVSISSAESIYLAGDKVRFLDLCDRVGIPHPKYCVAQNAGMLLGAAHCLRFPYNPICVKVSNQEGSRGFRIVVSDSEMRRLFLEEKPNTRCTTMQGLLSILDAGPFPELIVQEYVKGVEYSTDALCDKGKVLLMTCRANKRVNCSIPMESEICHNYLMCEYTKTLVRETGLDGNASLDFIMSRDGRIMALECNPRVSATVGLSRYAGINLVYLQVKRLLGEPLPHITAPYPASMKRELVASFKYRGGVLNG